VSFCESCQFGKQSRNPFPKEAVRSKGPLELIHSDVCRPMLVMSVGGSRYFATFIDDYTRYTAVYFMSEKTELLKYFKEFHHEAESVTGCREKCIRSDNGTEYVNKDFDRYLKECGIQRQLTAPYSPQQNGVAERANRTLLDSVRSMQHFQRNFGQKLSSMPHMSRIEFPRRLSKRKFHMKHFWEENHQLVISEFSAVMRMLSYQR